MLMHIRGVRMAAAVAMAVIIAVSGRDAGAQSVPPRDPAPALRTLAAQLQTMRDQVGELERVVQSPRARSVSQDTSVRPDSGAATLWCCARQIFEVNASLDAVSAELSRLRRSFSGPTYVERRAIIAEAEVELARARRALEAVAGAGSATDARQPLRSIERATDALRMRAAALDRMVRG